MKTTKFGFYVTGGTLRLDSPSYVIREADEELYASIKEGDFCYVLTSRQLGKSSLMVRTAVRLRKEGASTAVLDLTQIGQNLTVEQWYDGMIFHLGYQLHLEDELEEFWCNHQGLGPMQRFLAAICEVVLSRLKGQVVIFIDEIDAVLGLGFSTDEFFAGIRELYNRRVEDPRLERLTFCLLGVATPSDLILEPRTTPFNIGRRIELTDFTEVEATSLTKGLGCPQELAGEVMGWIFYWTGGHPYLTQRLCQSWSESVYLESEFRNPTAFQLALQSGAIMVKRVMRRLVMRLPILASLEQYISDTQTRSIRMIVDELCEDLFLSSDAKKRDTNLVFVRDYLLRNEDDLVSVLDAYGRILKRGWIPFDETSKPLAILRLSGIIWVEQGHAFIRNRIYRRVFNKQWWSDNLPESEQRRQRAAYRKGIVRATYSIGGIAILLVIFSIFAASSVAIRSVSFRMGEENQSLRQMNAQLISKIESISDEYDLKIQQSYRRAQQLQIQLQQLQRQSRRSKRKLTHSKRGVR